MKWKPITGAGGYLVEVQDHSESVIVTQTVDPQTTAIDPALMPGAYRLRITTLSRFLTAESDTGWIPFHVEASEAPAVGDFDGVELHPGDSGVLELPVTALAQDALVSLQTSSGRTLEIPWKRADSGLLSLTLPELVERGSYLISVTNPPRMTTKIGGKVSVHYPAPVIRNVEPRSFERSTLAQRLAIARDLFSSEAVVTLESVATGSRKTLPTVQGEAALLTSIPPETEPGDYRLSVANADNEPPFAAGLLSILPALPVIEQVTPQNADADEPLQLTVAGRNLLPGGRLELIPKKTEPSLPALWRPVTGRGVQAFLHCSRERTLSGSSPPRGEPSWCHPPCTRLSRFQQSAPSFLWNPERITGSEAC